LNYDIGAMMQIGTVVINVTGAGRAAGFWDKTRGYTRRSEGSLTLVPEGGDGLAVNLDKTDRMHLDLHAADTAE
jgi:hypothetical protein